KIAMFSQNPESRRTFVAVIVAILAVLGLLVGGITYWLRDRLRNEVLQREAEAIHAVALMEINAAVARVPGLRAAESGPVLFAAGTLGTARYWVDGESLAAEFVRMDRGLLGQAGLAYCGGAALVALVLAWAFARLGQANSELRRQRADLVRANQELDFAAKTGA